MGMAITLVKFLKIQKLNGMISCALGLGIGIGPIREVCEEMPDNRRRSDKFIGIESPGGLDGRGTGTQ